jgi:hypothetical protein
MHTKLVGVIAPDKSSFQAWLKANREEATTYLCITTMDDLHSRVFDKIEKTYNHQQVSLVVREEAIRRIRKEGHDR